jgi:lipopolysaccharide transport system permease protein
MNWLWVIPTFAIQMALSLGLMLILAPLNALYRDVGQAIPLFVQVWMYASPIVYPASLVPASLRPYYLLNPMAVIIESYRSAILRNELPNLPFLAFAALLASSLLVGGYYLFKRLERGIADVA